MGTLHWMGSTRSSSNENTPPLKSAMSRIDEEMTMNTKADKFYAEAFKFKEA
jgi:hypothetical protein